MRFFHTYPHDVWFYQGACDGHDCRAIPVPRRTSYTSNADIHWCAELQGARALHSCLGLVKWRVRSRALSFARERRRVFERCASLRVKNQRLLLLLPTYLAAPACLLIRRVRRFSASFRFFSFSASKYCVIVGMYTSSESSEISLNPVSFIAPIAIPKRVVAIIII